MKLPKSCEALSYTSKQNGMRGTSSTFRKTKNTYKALVRYMKQEISGRPRRKWEGVGSMWLGSETSDELL
jgi:uncharacterized protein YukE